LRNPTEKRQNHPLFSYLIGSVVLVLTIIVFLGVLHHLTVSHHGPELLKPTINKYFARPKTMILEEARRLEELEIHRHFHNIVQFPQIDENKQPACYICHSDYPHSKNKMIRSLLNMHTQYFVCETCHIKEDENRTVVFKWYNPVDSNPRGPFFGTRYDPETGNLAQVEDLISRIAPYYKKGGKLESAVQTQNAPLARDYLKVRDELTPEQRDVYKKKFHGNIKPKGYECEACHAKKGVLDFKELGFSENRTVDLQLMNIKGMITKYEEFYLPMLFK
jgi:hypothetical protein